MDDKKLIEGVNIAAIIEYNHELNKVARNVAFKCRIPKVPKFNSTLEGKANRARHFRTRVTSYENRLYNWRNMLAYHVAEKTERQETVESLLTRLKEKENAERQNEELKE
jgi:hypothetical protein